MTAQEEAARLAGVLIDREFLEACERVGLSVVDARNGSPLLSLYTMQKKIAQEREHKRYLRDKAKRVA